VKSPPSSPRPTAQPPPLPDFPSGALERVVIPPQSTATTSPTPTSPTSSTGEGKVILRGLGIGARGGNIQVEIRMDSDAPVPSGPIGPISPTPTPTLPISGVTRLPPLQQPTSPRMPPIDNPPISPRSRTSQQENVGGSGISSSRINSDAERSPFHALEDPYSGPGNPGISLPLSSRRALHLSVNEVICCFFGIVVTIFLTYYTLYIQG